MFYYYLLKLNITTERIFIIAQENTNEVERKYKGKRNGKN